MATKRETNFARSYADKTGAGAVSVQDAEVLSFNVSDFSPATVRAALLRYGMDVLVGVGNAVLKADGGTMDKAIAKMGETLQTLQDGTFAFRSASGQGGLSVEEEQRIIAEIAVKLGLADTLENALSKVEGIYALTATNKLGHVTRPDYNALKNVPDVKAALAKAGKVDTVGAIGSVFAKLETK